MIIVGWIASLVAGLLWWPWWVAVITTIVVIISANSETGGGLERLNISHPFMLAMMALPQFALWAIGSWFGGLFH